VVSPALSDEALLSGLAAGDAEAATAFTRRFQARVYGLVLTIVRDEGTAEDVAQETFVRAWRHAQTYDPRRGRVATWLLTIARNLAIDVVRVKRAEPLDPEIVLTKLERSGVSERPVDQASPPTSATACAARSPSSHPTSAGHSFSPPTAGGPPRRSASGRSFQAQRLTDEAGGRAGVAFGYEGSPSWLLLTIDPGHRDSVTRAELTTKDGRTIALRSLRLDSEGSWGGAIPVKLYDVASVRLLGPRSGDTLRATFPHGTSERD